MTRTNRVILIIGGRGSGKTTLGKNILLQSLNAHPEMYGLVVDTFDHPAYRAGFVRITPKMLERIKTRACYRVFGSNTYDIMRAVEAHCYNATILFEDASKYISGTVSEETRNFILDSKQKNLDLVFMFHGFGFVPPALYRLVDGIFLLRTNDSPVSRKALIPCYTQVEAAYNRILASKDPYPRESILLI